jgi:hypothetical protein
VFADPMVYEEVQLGDRLRVTGVLPAVRGQGDASVEDVSTGTRFPIRVDLRPYQREVLLAGGGIRYAQSRRTR